MTSKKQKYLLWFSELSLRDVPLVGGKNAALGEMYQNLSRLKVAVPNGFALTAAAYWYFLKSSGLFGRVKKTLAGLDARNVHDLQKRGRAVRQMILGASLPQDLQSEIRAAYRALGRGAHVAVRSSATAEDLPGASFAGQQETYLNVVGEAYVLTAVKKCIASLFMDRAISYRQNQGFSHMKVALSVGIQLMVRSDLGASGVAFTIDTESGFRDVVVINGSYGLGEMIVQGKVTPDEFIVWKPGLRSGHAAIISRSLGPKKSKMVYASAGIKETPVILADRGKFCLTDAEVLRLSRWCLLIEEHFSRLHRRDQPMDIEWARDGRTGELYIVQARPETVHSGADASVYREYALAGRGRLLLTGTAVGARIAGGGVKVIKSARLLSQFKKGEVLVTEITDPDWEPIMKIAAAIVTDKGGRTSHAAIVSRELGIPCIVGTGNASRLLKTGQKVTVDCSSGETGKIYEGLLKYKVTEHRLDHLPRTRTKIMVNIGSPDEAFKNHVLPARGVGLGRLEFIIASHIKIHPNALIDYHAGKLPMALRRQIDKLTAGYPDKKEYYVQKLAEGIAKIGAAFWPHEVIIRFSDFKTNEYRKLLGGSAYEPEEENPMIGWRGASRYYHPKFKAAFGLEVRAIRRVREEMGLANVTPMVPFCRTPEEGRRAVAAMAAEGLDRRKDKKLKIYVMCEIPSNILESEEFLDIFDGMSIGSNDLTQLALGLDRDSGIIAGIGNELSPSVKSLIASAIAACRARHKYIGICGQGPSDYPEFAAFLVRHKIDSISLNPDTVTKTLLKIHATERRA